MAVGQTNCAGELIASSEKFSDAFALLSQAHEYARDTEYSIWDFAVEIRILRDAGLTVSDLRWLVCRGLVEHAHEVTRPSNEHREFRSSGKLTFTERTCFVLTDEGIACGECAADTLAEPRDSRVTSTGGDIQEDGPTRHPSWDPERHELRMNGTLVKRFKWPALNQETILMAFEEEQWPPRIDDPLPPQPEQDPKRRLHDTIKCLNRNKKDARLRFRGDGTGEGVIWECVEDDNSAKPVR